MNMPAEHLPIAISLDVLLEGLAAAPSLPVTDIALDSRRLAPGSLFLACAGAQHHGLDFLDMALEAGAVAVAFDATTATDVPPDFDIPLIAVDELAGRLGVVANRFFDAPSKTLRVVGVTGTNGKSTVAWMIAQCLTGLGRRSGYSGTLGFGVSELAPGDDMTSPDVIELHRRLAGFRDDGATHAAIEVSSHALEQKRISGVDFDAVLFTNLSRDHLDYHGTMRAYGDAKARLFTDYRAAHRIINLDTEFGMELAVRCGGNVITVSTKFDRVANGRPYVFVRSVITRSEGSQVRVQSSWGDANLFVPLPGEYNVANAVLVFAYLLSIGIEPADASEVLGGIDAPPGRMQRVRASSGPAVYVDYAHTPEALDVALRGLRAHCRGQLVCVFGCGGDRDPGKRALMGRIAERLADRIVITNDNPRSESPTAIIDAILTGVSEPDGVTVIEDRAAAIAWAIADARASDIVLIAGKGHETYQLVDGQRLQFSDYGAAHANLEALLPEADA